MDERFAGAPTSPGPLVCGVLLALAGAGFSLTLHPTMQKIVPMIPNSLLTFGEAGRQQDVGQTGAPKAGERTSPPKNGDAGKKAPPKNEMKGYPGKAGGNPASEKSKVEPTKGDDDKNAKGPKSTPPKSDAKKDGMGGKGPPAGGKGGAPGGNGPMGGGMGPMGAGGGGSGQEGGASMASVKRLDLAASGVALSLCAVLFVVTLRFIDLLGARPFVGFSSALVGLLLGVALTAGFAVGGAWLGTELKFRHWDKHLSGIELPHVICFSSAAWALVGLGVGLGASVFSRRSVVVAGIAGVLAGLAFGAISPPAAAFLYSDHDTDHLIPSDGVVNGVSWTMAWLATAGLLLGSFVAGMRLSVAKPQSASA